MRWNGCSPLATETKTHRPTIKCFFFLTPGRTNTSSTARTQSGGVLISSIAPAVASVPSSSG